MGLTMSDGSLGNFHTINGQRVRATFAPVPIPNHRHYDWHGATEAEAIADLLENTP